MAADGCNEPSGRCYYRVLGDWFRKLLMWWVGALLLEVRIGFLSVNEWIEMLFVNE